jgi:hypothetical protein
MATWFPRYFALNWFESNKVCDHVDSVEIDVCQQIFRDLQVLVQIKK